MSNKVTDETDEKDAERFKWLIKRGIAWRDCYSEFWIDGEWLYGHRGAREEIDKAMVDDNKKTVHI